MKWAQPICFNRKNISSNQLLFSNLLSKNAKNVAFTNFCQEEGVSNVKTALGFTENKVLKIALFSRKIIAKCENFHQVGFTEKSEKYFDSFSRKKRCKKEKKAVPRKIADFYVYEN